MNKRWLLVGAAALVISGISATHVSAADKEENEQKIPFKEAPKKVRKTLKREANGEKIKSVDMEKLNGKLVFEADVEIDDHNYEIVVNAKGLLLSKRLDNEADEKSEAKTKESDEEDEAKKDSGKKHSAKEADDDDSKSTRKHKEKESDKDNDDDHN